MNLQDKHIGLWIYLFMMRTDEQRLCITFHVQHHSDSGGHYKQQNMLGLGKKKNLDFNRFSFLWTNIDY